MTVASNNATPPEGKAKISVRSAAKLLGVDKGHLSRVLRGLRISRRLLRRYNDLVATK